MAIRPPILRNGDTIGIVTLGSPLDASILNQRLVFLQNLGFRTLLGRYVYSFNGIVASSAAQRASDLMSMFQNRNVRAILPVRGGTGIADILPYLDYRIINQNPKIISGYSDITILLNVLYQFSNLITFNSLLLIDFNSNTPSYNFNQFFGLTSTFMATRVIQPPPGRTFISRIRGNVSGELVGGNMTSIIGSLGTPYEINTRGKILFLEDTHEPTNRIYRYITHLNRAGKFRDCIGIIMGDCTSCTTSYGDTYNTLINELIVPLGKPLMTNVSTAHDFYKTALPIGARINLNTINNTITILEPTVTI